LLAGSPAQFGKLITDETEKLGKVIQAVKLSLRESDPIRVEFFHTDRAFAMSALGHSRPSHSAPVPTGFRCYPKSDQKWCLAANDATGHKATYAAQKIVADSITSSTVASSVGGAQQANGARPTLKEPR
jgi:hypothetical protein